jgi:hypothetical protein
LGAAPPIDLRGKSRLLVVVVDELLGDGQRNWQSPTTRSNPTASCLLVQSVSIFVQKIVGRVALKVPTMLIPLHSYRAPGTRRPLEKIETRRRTAGATEIMRSKPCAGCVPVYALETDSLAEAAGFEPSHLRSEFSKTFSLGTGLDRIADARASLLNKVSGVPSDGQIRSSADLISRCRGSSPAASASQSVSNAY